MSNNNGKKIGPRAKSAGERDAPILSDILPLREPRFHGRIGSTYVDSEADIISLPTPPVGPVWNTICIHGENPSRDDGCQ
jgi:hypothetical protein